MKIKLISVGKLKEKYWKAAVAECQERLGAYCKLEIIECREERAPEGLSSHERDQILDREGQGILSHIKETDQVVSLAIQGQEVDSPQLAKKLGQWEMQGADLCLVIGGSLGLSQEVLDRSLWKWSFSPLTFPHQMVRVMVLEQVYRAYRIKEGHPYHK